MSIHNFLIWISDLTEIIVCISVIIFFLTFFMTIIICSIMGFIECYWNKKETNIPIANIV